MSFIRKQVRAYSCLRDKKVFELTLYMPPAVQSPMGDISYLLKFFREYVGLQASSDMVVVFSILATLSSRVR